METVTREAAIADYLACAERFPRFEGKPGETRLLPESRRKAVPVPPELPGQASMFGGEDQP